MTGDHPTGTSKSDHLPDDCLDMRHIHKDEPGMNKIKGACGQPCRGCIPLQHLNILERPISNKAPCDPNRPGILLDADHLSSGANALRQKVQHALWTTTEINGTAACANTYPVEQRSRFFSKLFRLHPQPSFLVLAVTEQVRLYWSAI